MLVCVGEYVHVRHGEERASDSARKKVDIEVGGSGSVYVWSQDQGRQVCGWLGGSKSGVSAGWGSRL